ncbi:MAG TPA: IS4 family transposase [Gemmataceae bacterium]
MDIEGIFRLYRKLLPSEFLQKLDGDCRRGGIFSTALVVWLLLWQRLEGGISLSTVMKGTALGKWSTLSGGSKRVKERRISEKTGGYSQARTRLSVSAAVAITDRVFQKLIERAPRCEGQRALFAVDGTTIALSSTPSVKRRYPPSQNQCGSSNSGILHVVVAHDLLTGYAARPAYGACMGPAVMTEAQLCRELLPRLPEDAVVVGDRNFGIFVSVFDITSSGRDVLVRLTGNRADKVARSKVSSGTDIAVTWQPSSDERRKYPHLPAGASVEGRVICQTVATRDGKRADLIVFTTLPDPAVKVLEMYALRWRLETDLRTLKKTVNLDHISAKSPEMLAKELLLGIAAYNLVHAFIAAAAARTRVPARSFSFSETLAIVRQATPLLLTARTRDERTQLLEKMLALAIRARLPHRRKPPDAGVEQEN